MGGGGSSTGAGIGIGRGETGGVGQKRVLEPRTARRKTRPIVHDIPVQCLTACQAKENHANHPLLARGWAISCAMPPC